MNSKWNFFIAVVLAILSSVVRSAPVDPYHPPDAYVYTTTTEVTLGSSSTVRPRLRFNSWQTEPSSLTTQQPVSDSSTFRPNIQGSRNPGRHSADYIVSDAEYQAYLEQLQQLAYSDVANNRDNYVSDNESIDDIMRRFEERERQLQQELQTIQGTISEENGVQSNGDQPTQRHSGGPDRGEDCPICLTPIEEPRDASRIPCAHKFHTECLENWKKQPLEAASKCPVCRTHLWR